MNSNQQTYTPIPQQPQQQYQQQPPQQPQYQAQPQYQSQPQYQVYQPQYQQQQQPLLYVQPVTCHTSVHDDHRHKSDEQNSLLILIVGVFCSIVWLANFYYIRSPSKKARTFAYVSIALFFTGVIVAIICVSVILSEANRIASNYSYDNHYSYSYSSTY